MWRSKTFPFAFLATFSLMILGFRPGAAADGGRPAPGSQAWLAEVDLLISDGERQAFLELPGEEARRQFARRFWRERDPYPQTARNELQESWSRRVAEAGGRWPPGGDRRLVFLLQGEPSERFESTCADTQPARRFDVWIYEPRFGVDHRMALFFQLGEDGAGRLWRPALDPADNLVDLVEVRDVCTEGERMGREVTWVRLIGRENYRALLERALDRPGPKSRDWYVGFEPVLAEAGDAAPLSPLEELQVEFPGKREGRRIVRLSMPVPESLGAVSSGRPKDGEGHEILLTGELLRPDLGVLESFRYQFRVPSGGGLSPGQVLPLVFERYLLPGIYQLKIKLVDLLTQEAFQGEKELNVPAFGAEPERHAAPEVRAALARLFAEADAARAAGGSSLRLVVPPRKVLVGDTRVHATLQETPELPEKRRVERVAFSLDGQRVLVRNRPPYDVILNLGGEPRARVLRAEGLGPGGEVLASDEVVLNAGAGYFGVSLVEPRPGPPPAGAVLARAEVDAPAGALVERVEFFVDDERVATLYQPPYSQPLLLPAAGEPGYLRAVAHLADGRRAEDIVLLLEGHSDPHPLDVRLVELFATVLDRSGRPVSDLDPERFAVFEGGARQQIRVCERAHDTPVRVVSLIDTSASMLGRMESTRRAALGFYQRTLRPQDRGAVVTFNRSPKLTVPLTNDLRELEDGFRGLLAQHETALWDSLVFALSYLREVEGQRAILLLSDGMDRTSRFSFDQALEAARRAGATIYSIGMKLEGGARSEAAQRLRRLARETGGQGFFVNGPEELPAVYEEIEKELRAQYRIAYQSSSNTADDRFRPVKVEVARDGVEVRTISGYYP
jgi:Ca-activated chloride channel homolog